MHNSWTRFSKVPVEVRLRRGAAAAWHGPLGTAHDVCARRHDTVEKHVMTSINATSDISPELLSELYLDDTFCPRAPTCLEETGLGDTLIESLICKHLATVGTSSGRSISDNLCLPISLLSDVLDSLRTRQLVTHAGAAALNDYIYTLTEHGSRRAAEFLEECAYVGPAPVPLHEYVLSVDAQSITSEAPDYDQLGNAFEGISVEPKLLRALGPAVNSGAGMFLFGAPGNGKSTVAKRITMCFGQKIWIPHAILEAGHLIKLFDPAFHMIVDDEASGLLTTKDRDRRWIKIERPTVVVGGELTMDNLEINHSPRSNVCEAPLHMKSNCGCLLLDDLGRQRIAPNELLNRWIVPLECRYDFLTLPGSKKIQVPFDQLIIFSTNLEPEDLVDEAFLRRIPHKIEIGDPNEEEFHYLFRLYCESFGCEYRKEVVNNLIARHYRPVNRAMRRCHPRDLIKQVASYCRYHHLDLELRPEYLDYAVESYFALVFKRHLLADASTSGDRHE